MTLDPLNIQKLSSFLQQDEKGQFPPLNLGGEDDDGSRLRSAMTAVDRHSAIADQWVGQIIDTQVSKIVDMQRAIIEHIEDARLREQQAQRQMRDLTYIHDALNAAIDKLSYFGGSDDDDDSPPPPQPTKPRRPKGPIFPDEARLKDSA